MNTDRLFNVMSAIHPLSNAFKAAIEKELTLLSLPKNYILLEAPEIAGQACFLDAGFAMSYIYMEGKKQIEGFWISGQVIISTRSFFEQVPSQEFIQLVESSEILCISYAGVIRLFDAFPEAHFIYRVIMNQYYERSRERIREMQHLNALERYERLLDTFPSIEQIVPQIGRAHV